jgi:hypothetical protein
MSIQVEDPKVRALDVEKLQTHRRGIAGYANGRDGPYLLDRAKKGLLGATGDLDNNGSITMMLADVPSTSAMVQSLVNVCNSNERGGITVKAMRLLCRVLEYPSRD